GLAVTTAQPALSPARHDAAGAGAPPGPAVAVPRSGAVAVRSGVAVAVPRSGTAVAARDASSGSGRSHTATTAAASTNATDASTKGAALGPDAPCPACASSPRRSTGPATRSAAPARVGPTTEPTVVAHTTTDRSRARRSGVARSVAGKRDASPAAAPEPNSSIATTSRGHEPTSTATVARTAPPAATPNPSSSDGRRPRRPATSASGRATSAAPTTPAVDVSPAIASEPESADATSGATAMPLATPTPERTCVAASVVRVRRWLGRPGTSDGPGGAGDRSAGCAVLTPAR